jgi:hypothetical protein
MKKTLRTVEVLNAYGILSKAKYQKLNEEDKIKIWKVQRNLKPIAKKFEEDKADATENLIPSDFIDRLSKAQEYEALKEQGEENLPITDVEYIKVLKEIKNYNRLIAKALKEIGEKEVTITFEPISEKAFGELMSSNDWSLKEVELIDFIVQ